MRAAPRTALKNPGRSVEKSHVISPGTSIPEVFVFIALFGAGMVVFALAAVGRALEIVDLHEAERRKLHRRRSGEPPRF